MPVAVRPVRSAMAVNLLAQAGCTDAWNITDGMEGDLVNDAESSDAGKRTKNGWKNSGLRWNYQIGPERMRLFDR